LVVIIIGVVAQIGDKKLIIRDSFEAAAPARETRKERKPVLVSLFHSKDLFPGNGSDDYMIKVQS
jgi:hypothetical protein